MWPYIHSMASSSVMAESVEEIAGTSLADFKPVGRGSSIAKRKSHLGSCVLLPSQRALWVEHGSWRALWVEHGGWQRALWWNMAAGGGPCGGTWRLGGAPSEWNMAAGSGPCGRTWWLGACPVGGPGGERPQPGVPSLSGVLSGRHSGSSASRSLPTACWNEGAAHPPRLGLVPKGPGMNVGAQIRPRGHGEDPRVGGGGPEGLVNEKSRDWVASKPLEK